MGETVLDTSVVLAILDREPGYETAMATIYHATINTVTLAEVVTKLADRGMNDTEIRGRMNDLRIRVVPFDENQAYIAGLLRPVSRQYGLSLGDRACLSLAVSSGLPVLTADRVWADIPIDIEVRLMR